MTLDELNMHRDYFEHFRELPNDIVKQLFDIAEEKLKEGEVTLTPIAEKPRKIKAKSE